MKQMMQVVEVCSPIQGSMVGDSMPELRREAEALGTDAVALTEAYSGAFGLSAGVTMDLRSGWDLGQRADQVKAEKRFERRATAFAHFESRMLGPLSATTHQARRGGRIAGAGQASLGVCMQSGQKCKSSKVGAFSLEYPLAGFGGAVLVEAEADRWPCAVLDAISASSERLRLTVRGTWGLACKATGFMTNDEYIAEAVNRHCVGGPDQHPVVEGQSEIL